MKTLSTHLIFALSCAVTSQAYAEINPLPQAHSASTAVNHPMTMPTQTEKVVKGAQLRCWQDGVLLFEETNLKDQSLAAQANTLYFQKQDQSERNEKVYLMQLGQSTCLYKHS